MAVASPEVLLPIACLGERFVMASNFGEIKTETRNGKLRWFLYFWFDNPHAGIRQRERLYSGMTQNGKRVPFDSEQVAQIYLDAIRGDVRRGLTEYQALAPYLYRKAPENLVKVRWKAYVKARREERDIEPVSESRLYELGQMVDRHYLDYFQAVSIFEITKPLLDQWVRWMIQQWPAHSPKTRHHIANDFMGFLHWLKGKQDIQQVPDKPKLPKLEKRRKVVPDEAALERYLQAIPEPIRGLWLIRGYDGLRPSEARRLNISNYDWRTRAIAIEDTKTENGVRTFEVDWEVSEWLDRHVPAEARLDGARPLFINPGSPSGRWRRTAEVRIHDQAALEAGLVDGTGRPLFAPNHMGRHAAATHMMARTKARFGAHDIDAVKRKLGHAERSTTETYIDPRIIEVASIARIPRRDS